MYLITGMPRAGTSFLQKVFAEYGGELVPRIYTTCKYDIANELSASEPSIIGKLCHSGGSFSDFEKALEAIEAYHAQPGAKTMIKQPQLSFYAGVCGLFERIIVCLRTVDEAYLASGRSHSMDSWLLSEAQFLKRFEGSDLEALAHYWRRYAQKLMERYHQKVLCYHYGDRASFSLLMQNFTQDENLIKEAWVKHWRGSRFAG